MKRCRTLGTKVTKDIKRRFTEVAEANGLTPSALLRELVTQYLDSADKANEQGPTEMEKRQVYDAIKTSQHHEKTHNDDPSFPHKISLTDTSSNKPSHGEYPHNECLQPYRLLQPPKPQKPTLEAYTGQPNNEGDNDRFSSLFLSPKGNEQAPYTCDLKKPETSAKSPLGILLLLAGSLYFLAK